MGIECRRLPDCSLDLEAGSKPPIVLHVSLQVNRESSFVFAQVLNKRRMEKPTERQASRDAALR